MTSPPLANLLRRLSTSRRARSQSTTGSLGSPLSPPPLPSLVENEDPDLDSTPRLRLQVPTHGMVFMPTPPDPLIPLSHQQARDDVVLRGKVEVADRQAAYGIRVGLRSTARLNMGQGREGEEDILFETKLELVLSPMNGNGQEVERRSPVEIYEFSLIIPANLAPHEYYSNGTITHELFAELYDREILFSPSEGTPIQSPSYLLSSSTPISSPPYEQSGFMFPPRPKTQKILASTRRHILLVYNPTPSGGVNTLLDSMQEVTGGLGAIDIRLKASEFSIGCPFSLLAHIPSPSPAATIFSIAVRLSQTVTFTSPRDKSSIQHKTQHWILYTEGKRPGRQHVHPSRHIKALWRGARAGGKDKGGWKVDGRGRVPTGDSIRPSSLQGVATPIQVQHTLNFEMYFSIFAEDSYGRRMETNTPGALRVFRWVRPTVIPACWLISGVLDLPQYPKSAIERDASTSGSASPSPVSPSTTLCPMCHQQMRRSRSSSQPQLQTGDETSLPCPFCTRQRVGDSFVCACVDWVGKRVIEDHVVDPDEEESGGGAGGEVQRRTEKRVAEGGPRETG